MKVLAYEIATVCCMKKATKELFVTKEVVSGFERTQNFDLLAKSIPGRHDCEFRVMPTRSKRTNVVSCVAGCCHIMWRNSYQVHGRPTSREFSH